MLNGLQVTQPIYNFNYGYKQQKLNNLFPKI